MFVCMILGFQYRIIDEVTKHYLTSIYYMDDCDL